MAEALQLQQDMRDFSHSFSMEVSSVLQRTPLTIRPRKVKVDLDAEESDSCEANLPSPLQPLPVGSSNTPTTDVTASSPPPPTLPSPLKPQLVSAEVAPAVTAHDGSAKLSECVDAAPETVEMVAAGRVYSAEGVEEKMDVAESSSGRAEPVVAVEMQGSSEGEAVAGL